MSFKHTVFAFAAFAAFVAATPAQAQLGAAVSADLGTTGAGFHLVVPMETYLNGRFGANYFKHDFDKRSGQVDYKVDAKLRTFDLLFDWYVIPQSNFRLTGGVVYNGNRLDASARPGADGRFTFNNTTYAAGTVGTVTGEVTFRRASPYLGIGWGNALTPNKRWNVGADLGVFHQGKARVNLVALGCTGSNAVCNKLTSDVAVEEARLVEEASDFQVYPVLRASLSYSF